MREGGAPGGGVERGGVGGGCIKSEGENER